MAMLVKRTTAFGQSTVNGQLSGRRHIGSLR